MSWAAVMSWAGTSNKWDLGGLVSQRLWNHHNTERRKWQESQCNEGFHLRSPLETIPGGLQEECERNLSGPEGARGILMLCDPLFTLKLWRLSTVGYIITTPDEKTHKISQSPHLEHWQWTRKQRKNNYLKENKRITGKMTKMVYGEGQCHRCSSEAEVRRSGF